MGAKFDEMLLADIKKIEAQNPGHADSIEWDLFGREPKQ